jgi:predicted ribonuclease toxin of YeeF-YezG toxin-antitoxin module
MSNGVVQALDHAAVRLGKALGQDTGKAVSKLYRTAGGKVKKNVERSIKADAEKAADIKKIAAQMEKNAAKNVSTKAEKAAQAKEHAVLRSKLKAALDPKYTYRRPTGYREGVRDKVWDKAKKTDGKVYDPLTKKEMDKDEPWDMGHKPGYEFRKHRDSAYKRGISRDDFLDEHNDPSHYQPELPESNQGHAGEDHSSTFLGDP